LELQISSGTVDGALIPRKFTTIYGSNDHKHVSSGVRAYAGSNDLYSRNTSIRTYLNFLRYDAHRIANGNVGYLDGTLEINLSSNTAPARLQRNFPSICISIMRPSEFPHCAAACCVCHVPHRVILEASAQSINYTHIKTNSTAQM
jgi:hypothetical protein